MDFNIQTTFQLYRKLPKSHCDEIIDIRKNRDEKAFQIRKEKRADRTNIERRKFKCDDKTAPSMESSDAMQASMRNHNTEIYQQKCVDLISDQNPKLVMDAVVYFRRILSIGKAPPLALVFASNGVVEALCNLMRDSLDTSLQYEAVWAITNLACGEAHHIETLLRNNIIQSLSQIIATSPIVRNKLQALWALNNLSNDETACKIMAENGNLVTLILHQVGVLCFSDIARGDYHGTATASSPIDDSVEQLRPQHIERMDNPTLSSMRHVAFMCGNFIKSKAQLSKHIFRCIFFALADLLHSPDEEILLDTCQTISVACLNRPELIDLVLEQGMLSRLKELIDSAHCQELAIAAVCTLIRSPSPLHRRLVLAAFSTLPTRQSHFLPKLVELLASTTNNSTIKDILYALPPILQLGPMHARKMVECGLIEVIHRIVSSGMFESRVEAGYLLYKIVHILDFDLPLDYFPLILRTFRDLLISYDTQLLLHSLQTMNELVQRMRWLGIPLPDCVAEVTELEILIMHPVHEISQQASLLQNILSI